MQQVNIFDEGSRSILKFFNRHRCRRSAHHRMNAAEEFYLFVSVLAGLVGEVLHASQARVATWARHRNHNVPDPAWKLGCIDDRLNLPLGYLRFSQRAMVPVEKSSTISSSLGLPR